MRSIVGIGLLIWAGVVTLVVYGGALSLPFFFDDLVHIPFVDGHSWGEILRTSGNLAYYRPVSFLVWKGMSEVAGGHVAGHQHLFNLVVHALNAWLVGWLAGRLWGGDEGGRVRLVRQVLAVLFFVIFPFSYQAVPWVGALSHLLVTLWILLAVVFYVLWADTEWSPFAFMSLVFALVACFTHENGVLVGAFVVVVALTRSQVSVRHTLLWFVPAVVWLPIWWFAPKNVGDGATGIGVGSAETLLQNTAYFSQGITFPISWLGNFLVDLGINDLIAALGLGGGFLLTVLIINIILGADRRMLLPYFWVAIAILPSVLFLTFDYVINGPRLLMVASVGAVWLWADFLANLTTRRLGTIFAIGLALITAGQSYLFVREKMMLHATLGDAYERLTAQVEGDGLTGRRSAVINLPSWIAPVSETYALGHEGVQGYPDYAPIKSLVEVNSGETTNLVAGRIDALFPPPETFVYGIAGNAPDWREWGETQTAVYMTDLVEGRYEIKPVGELGRVKTDDLVASYRIDGKKVVNLLSATASIQPHHLIIDLSWEMVNQPPSSVTVFVHLLDENGVLVAQSDGFPLAGAYPMSGWQNNEVVLDRRYLSGNGNRLLVGLYDGASGERLEAISAETFLPLNDNATPLQINP